MDINAEVFEVVGKTAGIGGIAVVVFLFILMKLISGGIIKVMRPMQVFRLLRLVVNWAGVIAVAGIAGWLISVYMGKHTASEVEDELSRAKEFSEDERLKEAETLHYTGRDSEKIYDLLEELVQDENPLGEAFLSDKLFNDMSTKKDVDRAISLAQKSFPKLQNWCSVHQMPAACFYLGEMYSSGVFVGGDQLKAFELIKFSADHGYQRAYVFLGAMYQDGEGVESSKDIARKWLIKSASFGNGRALYLLAQSYKDEDGVKYLDYLRQSVDKGYPRAELELSLIYREGVILPRDAKKARFLLEDSLKDTSPDSFFVMGLDYEMGANDCPRDLVKARGFYKKGAEYGSLIAMDSYGLSLLYGKGGVKDEIEALKWLKKSAERGGASAKSSLGMLYEQGVAVAKNTIKAIEYYTAAAEENDAYAIGRLFEIHRDGIGVSADKVEARKWVERGVAINDVELTYMAGRFFYENIDAKEGLNLLEKAVSLGSAEAASVLGSIFEGRGGAANMAVAKEYFTKAKELDSSNKTYEVDVHYSNFVLSTLQVEKDAAVSKVLEFAKADDKWAQYRMYEIYRSPDYQRIDESMRWLEISAKNGHPCASVDYGLALLRGDHVKKDLPGAIHWLEEGFAGGRPNAGFNLGVIYVTGELTTQDVVRGLKYLNDAAGMGSNESRVYLARIYKDGKYMPKDIVKSQDYLVKAAVDGNEEAKKILEGASTPQLQSCAVSIN